MTPPGIFLKAAEVLRRQLFAFCLDDWVSNADECDRASGQDISSARCSGTRRQGAFPLHVHRSCAHERAALVPGVPRLCWDLISTNEFGNV